MPQVNLSDLSGPDLRRLLDATRGRGDAALSYTILQEMAARREGRGQRGRFLMRRRAEPHVVAVDLRDPMEREDDLPPMPHWRQPPPEAEPEASVAAELGPLPAPAGRQPRQGKMEPVPPDEPAIDVEPAPPPSLDVEPSPGVQDPDPEPLREEVVLANLDLRLREPGLGRLPVARRRGGLLPGLAVGIAVGVALGWWLGGIDRDTPPPAAPPAAPVAAPVLAAASAAPIEAEPEPAPEAPPDPAVVSPPPAADAVEVAADAQEEASIPPAQPAAEAAVASSIPVARDVCAAEPTPADREICGDPQLRQLQRELRQAYAEALDAHQDRALLRERQLAWKGARDSVSDPDRLVALYEERIHKLHAATAAARQQR